jgi:tetratricopeptide (TPR) repeat protein
MAPEQVGINALDVDTRSDVYALGVILYELLTGTTPLEKKRVMEAAWEEVRRMIREEEPPQPSLRLSTSAALASLAAQRQTEPAKLSRLVRGELDWIVLKALEKDRNRRYETANGLALDVLRHLADEPVVACPPSAGYRLRKFARKHRAGLTAGAAFAALLVVAALATTWLAVRAVEAREEALAARDAEAAQRRQAEEQRDRATAAERQAQQNEAAQRQRAEAAQRQAMSALRATTDDVVERLIGSKPELGPAERAFLDATLKRWQAFAAAKGEGEQARAVGAEGALRVAALRAKLGQNEAALAGYREAVALRTRLAADFPAAPEHRSELAVSHNSLGVLLMSLGKLADAEAALRQSATINEELAAEFPAVHDHAFRLAANHSNLGVLLRDLGRWPKAEAANRRAIALNEKLAIDLPNVPALRRDLAIQHNNLGLLAANQGRHAEAEAELRQALTTLGRLADEFPAVADYRNEQGRTLRNLGDSLHQLGRAAEAETMTRQAVAVLETLAADFPAVPDHRSNLGFSLDTLGRQFQGRGQWAEAEAAHRRALAVKGKLAADFPAVPHYGSFLSAGHVELGSVLGRLGRPAEAEAEYRVGLSLYEKLVAAYPAAPGYRNGVGTCQVNLAALRLDAKQPAQALEWYDKAVALLESVHRDVPLDADTRQKLLVAYCGRAGALDRLGRPTDALAAWDKAMTFAPDSKRGTVRLEWALTRLALGEVGEALQMADEVAEHADAVTSYNAACVCARAAARGGSLAGSPPPAACADRAMELLRQAVAKGFRDVQLLKADDDLAAVRDREDFRALLAELEKAVAPPARR